MAAVTRAGKKNRPARMVVMRRATQIALVALALTMTARHYLLHGSAELDAVCPLGGVETLLPLALHDTFLRKLAPSSLVVLAATLATALLMGRAFCGWLCPLGAVQEWLAGLSRRLTGGKRAWLPLRVPLQLDRPLRWVKYVALGLLLLASLSSVVPPLEPFCPFKTLFQFRLSTTLSWSVLAMLVVGSLLVERFWCRYLCPLGALLAVFNKVAPLRVNTGERCVECGRCGRTCGMGIEQRPEAMRSGECIRCLDCLDSCNRPEAIELRLG